MNITQITKAIVVTYPTRQPLFVHGAPGVGKSDGVAEAANVLRSMLPALNKAEKTNDKEFGLIDLRLSIREPTDLLGVMWPDTAKGIVKNFPSSFLPRSGRGILFLDEFPDATRLMQGAASQLILDRILGEYELPPGWMVMGAGNRVSDRASANAMPTQMKNRFVHLYAEVDVDSWVVWALAHNIDVRVIAFIKFRRQLLHMFDPQMKGEAFASPRSWEFVSRNLPNWSIDRGLLSAMIRGSVGEGSGAEFDGFLRVADKIQSPEAILLNPKTATIPDDMAALYATVTALSSLATKDSMASICTYFGRLSNAGKPDFAIAAIKEMTARKDGPALSQTKAFIKFASDHNHLLV